MLDKVSLINPGNHVTLSYYWGDPSITKHIIVNDISVKVTVNLENALRHLQRRYSIRIWVDALCVNQAGDQERGLQVRPMKRAYEKASQAIAVATRVIIKCGNDALLWENLDAAETVYTSAAESRIGPFSTDSFKSTSSMFTQAWQEPGTPGYRSGDSYSYVKQISTFRRRISENGDLSLIEAIRVTHESLSTDPQDKVFALLRLCHDIAVLVPRPNYKQSVNDIQRDMALIMMKVNNSMDILPLRSPKGESKIASPDWVLD